MPAQRLVCLLLFTCLASTVAATRDRRVVDRVQVGDASSERDHAYDGADVTSGMAGGHTFRQTRGWMRYALNVFDDNDVIIACTFVGNEDAPRTVDLLVENHAVTTYTLAAHSTTPTTVEFRVPFEFTRGRTNIQVTLHATTGPTPALFELRTLQDHLEE